MLRNHFPGNQDEILPNEFQEGKMDVRDGKGTLKLDYSLRPELNSGALANCCALICESTIRTQKTLKEIANQRSFGAVPSAGDW